jgi:hypothetical protein
MRAYISGDYAGIVCDNAPCGVGGPLPETLTEAAIVAGVLEGLPLSETLAVQDGELVVPDILAAGVEPALYERAYSTRQVVRSLRPVLYSGLEDHIHTFIRRFLHCEPDERQIRANLASMLMKDALYLDERAKAAGESYAASHEHFDGQESSE